MTIYERLEHDLPAILDEACAALSYRRLPHYNACDEAENRVRLEHLLKVIHQALAAQNLIPIAQYSEDVARARFEAGYGVDEVQAAFNALESALWRWVERRLPTSEHVAALELISSVLGAGKEALATNFVAMARSSVAQRINTMALFAGT